MACGQIENRRPSCRDAPSSTAATSAPCPPPTSTIRSHAGKVVGTHHLAGDEASEIDHGIVERRGGLRDRAPNGRSRRSHRQASVRSSPVLTLSRKFAPDRPHVAGRTRWSRTATRFGASLRRRATHRAERKRAVVALLAEIEAGKRAQQAMQRRRVRSCGLAQVRFASLGPFAKQVWDAKLRRHANRLCHRTGVDQCHQVRRFAEPVSIDASWGGGVCIARSGWRDQSDVSPLATIT